MSNNYHLSDFEDWLIRQYNAQCEIVKVYEKSKCRSFKHYTKGCLHTLQNVINEYEKYRIITVRSKEC